MKMWHSSVLSRKLAVSLRIANSGVQMLLPTETCFNNAQALRFRGMGLFTNLINSLLPL